LLGKYPVFITREVYNILFDSFGAAGFVLDQVRKKEALDKSYFLQFNKMPTKNFLHPLGYFENFNLCCVISTKADSQN